MTLPADIHHPIDGLRFTNAGGLDVWYGLRWLGRIRVDMCGWTVDVVAGPDETIDDTGGPHYPTQHEAALTLLSAESRLTR